MGRAIIISETGGGLYQVQPVIDKARSTAEISRLTGENSAIDSRLTELVAEITTASNAVDTASDELKAALINKDDDSVIKQKQDALRKAESVLIGLTGSREYLKLKKTANTKRIEYLQEKTADPAQIAAWCTDYSEGLTGEVGTVELGRQNTAPIIKPGDSGAAYVAADDGILQPLPASSAAGVFYNLAVLPGVAKWRPRYRTGTASNIDVDTNTMDVALDALELGGINCNQADSLSAVPVQYMTCNAQAFTAGDPVLVEFTGQDFAQPVVVGFVHDPVACDPHGLVCSINHDDIWAGDPTDDVRLSFAANQWRANDEAIDYYGLQSWIDEDGTVWGFENSHADQNYFYQYSSRYENVSNPGDVVYKSGKEYMQGPDAIYGLGRVKGRNGINYIIVICRTSSGYFSYQKIDTGAVNMDSGGWVRTYLEFLTPESRHNVFGWYPWFFSADGSEAQALVPVYRDFGSPAVSANALTRVKATFDPVTNSASFVEIGTELTGQTSSYSAVQNETWTPGSPDYLKRVTTTTRTAYNLIAVDYDASGEVLAWLRTEYSNYFESQFWGEEFTGDWRTEVVMTHRERTYFETSGGISVLVHDLNVSGDKWKVLNRDDGANLYDGQTTWSDSSAYGWLLAFDLRTGAGVLLRETVQPISDRIVADWTETGGSEPYNTFCDYWQDFKLTYLLSGQETAETVYTYGFVKQLTDGNDSTADLTYLLAGTPTTWEQPFPWDTYTENDTSETGTGQLIDLNDLPLRVNLPTRYTVSEVAFGSENPQSLLAGIYLECLEPEYSVKKTTILPTATLSDLLPMAGRTGTWVSLMSQI